MALNNYLRYKTDIIKSIFGDRDTFNFKYGLEYALNGNLQNQNTSNSNVSLNMDEDPTILGFDLVILDDSALFNQMENFFDFTSEQGYQDIIYRRELYEDFKKSFGKFFNTIDNDSNNFRVGNEYAAFKTHYLNSIEGLNDLIKSTKIGNTDDRQFTNYGVDKLTFTLSEDVGLNSGYLSALYRNLIYSKKNGRQLIPENLLRFDCVVIVSEIRNFVRISNSLSQVFAGNQNPALVEEDILKLFKDNISRYIYTLYDCQFDFNTYSHGNNLNIGGFGGGAPEISDGLTFDMYYKYAGFEMEKFEFSPDIERIGVKYLNDSKMKPDSYQANPNEESSLNAAQGQNPFDKFPERLYDLRYRSLKGDEDLRIVEQDFPMISKKWARMDTIQRQRNQEAIDTQTGLRRGLNRLISNINRATQAEFATTRAGLIAGLTQQIRRVSQLRNINAPTNVYYSGNFGQVVLDNLKSFGNIGLSSALGTAANFLNSKSRGLEDSVFDISNRGIDSLRGIDTNNPFERFTDDSPSSIPNVYRRS